MSTQVVNNMTKELLSPMMKKQIEMALPKHLSPDRMLRIAMTELRKNKKLANCHPHSFLGAVVQCSQLGLEPGNNLGHAYLVPYKEECQLIIGYRGMIDLARRSGQVISLSAQPVYENDIFDFEYGLEEVLRHKPAKGDRGEIVAFYAVAHLKGGGYQFEVMWKDKIDEIRDTSEGYKYAKKFKKDTPWISHYDEMGRKTVLRRLFKYLPVSIEIQQAVTLDEAADRGAQRNALILNDGLELDMEDGQVITENKSENTKKEKPLKEGEWEEMLKENSDAYKKNNAVEKE